MSEQYGTHPAEAAMTEAWRQWEGQVVNGEFHLREYLGGNEHSAAFRTEYGIEEPQPAVIKLVPENSPNAESREASWQLALGASHPSLIQIFQTGRCEIGDAKLLFAVMEYAEENLAQIVPQRALTETEAREMLPPALDALAYLHAKGLAHGRVKPANILAKGDQLKLSSDGLHRAGSAIDDRSPYDPPEAVSSPAGDMWSLGMTLVEVLTQHLPVWERNGQRDPEVPGTLPGPFFEIARNCLRREPKARWKASDVADRLNGRVKPAAPAVAEKIPARAVPKAVQPPVQPMMRASVQKKGLPKRNPYLVPSVIVLLALVGFAGWKMLNHSSKGAEQIAQATPEPVAAVKEQAQSTETQTPVASPSVAAPPIATPQAAAPAPATKAPAAAENKASTGGVVHQVLPDVPANARETIQGAVKVGIRVAVDASGKVTDVEIESAGPSKYFANLALQSSRRWSFAASGATSDWVLHYYFTSEGTRAWAQEATR